MKKSVDVKRLTYTALLIAAGILLPQVFHLIGGSASGKLFLPMHIPVLLAGFLLGPVSGLAVGLLSPLLSSLLTGMPAAAILPFMTIELIAYGIFGGIFYKSLKKVKGGLLISLIFTMIAGRLANALALFVAGSLMGLKVPAVVSVLTAVGAGIPGIIIQLILIPILVLTLRKVGHFHD